MSRSMNFEGKAVVCKGDTTTTGGRVLEGAPETATSFFRCDGIPMALKGHKVSCPACGKVGVIAEGTTGITFFGTPTALDGHIVACGCPYGSHRLIASSTPRTIERSASSIQASLARWPRVEREETVIAPPSHVVQPIAQEEPVTSKPAPIPVFAKSCLRGAGCTDAGTSAEPAYNFGDMALFHAVSSAQAAPVQHAQAAKKPSAAALTAGLAAGTATTAAGTTETLTTLRLVGGTAVTSGRWLMNTSPIGAVVLGMMPGTLNDGEQDFIKLPTLKQIAAQRGTAPTRVRFKWVDVGNGRLEPRGYHTSADSRQDHVPVRYMTLNGATGNYEFTADGEITPTIYWNPNKLDVDIPQHTGNSENPNISTPITVLPIPEESGAQIETYPAPEEKGFQDYILILPIPNIPPLYVYLSEGRKGLPQDGHDYHRPPRTDEITGIAGLQDVAPKTPKQNGNGKRKRWKDSKGKRIYEWDSQHGELETYRASDGEHLGSVDYKTGEQLKPAVKGRNIKRYL